jgi:hypothetical protein
LKFFAPEIKKGTVPRKPRCEEFQKLSGNGRQYRDVRHREGFFLFKV